VSATPREGSAVWGFSTKYPHSPDGLCLTLVRASAKVWLKNLGFTLVGDAFPLQGKLPLDYEKGDTVDTCCRFFLSTILFLCPSISPFIIKITQFAAPSEIALSYFFQWLAILFSAFFIHAKTENFILWP
jgi:hypothetical protein